MPQTAKIFTTITLEWQCERGREHECEVEVDCTFDGDDLRITGTRTLGNTDSMGDDDFDDQVFEAVSDIAPEAYAEWLAEYGEYLNDCAAGRKAA